MPRTGERGGPQTRARISQIATALFLERGFDAVTVTEVAREAGVSSVTVFNHFPRKEDLFLDRADDAAELLRSAVRDRGDLDVLDSLHAALVRLADEHHALSGLAENATPFFRTVAASPALVARAREIGASLHGVLAAELGDELLASLVVSGYTTVLVGTARRLMAGEADVELDHRARLERLFAILRRGA